MADRFSKTAQEVLETLATRLGKEKIFDVDWLYFEDAVAAILRKNLAV